jgi:hypothetical protein
VVTSLSPPRPHPAAGARIFDKPTIINDRWITIPFIRDQHGDRPVMTLADLTPKGQTS